MNNRNDGDCFNFQTSQWYQINVRQYIERCFHPAAWTEWLRLRRRYRGRRRRQQRRRQRQQRLIKQYLTVWERKKEKIVWRERCIGDRDKVGSGDGDATTETTATTESNDGEGGGDDSNDWDKERERERERERKRETISIWIWNARCCLLFAFSSIYLTKLINHINNQKQTNKKK